jgi:Pyruvate/oxaloacetate carboxyltransferase
MLINQVPGGMLSILEKQLLDLKKQNKLNDLIKEIPKIRADVGYVPLVTPSSQIVGAQALMNILDGKRYKTLNKEFVDLVIGKYGKIPGKISLKLKKKIEKYDYDSDINFKSIKEHRADFSKFLKENNIKDISRQDTHLLNFILFPKESKEYYQAKNKSSMNDIIGLQEGFGLYVE